MSGPRRRQMAVKTPPRTPPNRRPLALAAAGMAGLVVIVIVVLVLLGNHTDPPFLSSTTRPPATSAPPSGSASSVGSPSQSAVPSTTPGEGTATPPEPTATASGPPPTPTPPPSELVEAPMREIVFAALGIDNPVAPEATERRLTFNVDGRGEIRVTVSDITAGLVQMCLSPGDGSTPPDPADCVVTPENSLKRTPEFAGPWTLVLAGAQAGRSPAITLLVRFPSTAPQLELDNFRFQGQDSPNYTGFDLKLTALADGRLVVATAWDDGLGGNYPYTMSLLDLSVEFEEPVVVEGTSHLATAERDVADEHTYEITITNLQEEIIDAVFLHATITWP